jgi:hypothetical protein
MVASRRALVANNHVGVCGVGQTGLLQVGHPDDQPRGLVAVLPLQGNVIGPKDEGAS